MNVQPQKVYQSDSNLAEMNTETSVGHQQMMLAKSILYMSFPYKDIVELRSWWKSTKKENR